MADVAESTTSVTRDHKMLLALARLQEEHRPLHPYAAILLTICDKLCAGGDSFVFPGSTPLADFLGVSRGTVINARRQLVAAGLVKIDEGSRMKQVWRLGIPEPTALDLMLYERLLGRSGVVTAKPTVVKSSEPSTPAEVVTTSVTRKERKRRNIDEGEQTTKKSRTMSDEDKLLACSSLANMERWLLWGAEGLHEADDSKLKATQMNWRAANPSAETPELKVKEWTPQHFAAYFWWQVSKYRETHNLPISMPDIGRICKAVVTMRTKLTAWQLAQRIANVCGHFDLIRFELEWANIALDEAALQDSNITKKIIDIETGGEFGLQARYAKLQAAVNERGNNG